MKDEESSFTALPALKGTETPCAAGHAADPDFADRSVSDSNETHIAEKGFPQFADTSPFRISEHSRRVIIDRGFCHRGIQLRRPRLAYRM